MEWLEMTISDKPNSKNQNIVKNKVYYVKL